MLPPWTRPSIRAQRLVCPRLPGASRITLAHAALHARGSARVCSIPIVHLEKMVGAVTLEGSAGQPLTREALERCEHVVNLVGPLLALKAESEVSALARIRRACGRQWQRLREPGERPFKLAVGGSALLLLLALWVPVAHTASARSRVSKGSGATRTGGRVRWFLFSRSPRAPATR